MKAVLITKENQSMLMGRYYQEEEVFFPIGYYLVTDFGDENMDFSLLNQTMLDTLFDRGPNILHGFFEITKKD